MEKKKPQIRFNGFEGEWVSYAFRFLFTEKRDTTQDESEDQLLSCAIDGIYLNSELFNHFRGSTTIGYLKVKRYDLILSAQNLHLGNANVNLRFASGIISPAYKVYTINGEDPYFINAWVKSEHAKSFFMSATTEGASLCRKNIEWEFLYDKKICIPSIPEQEKIGVFLTTLDKLIAKLEAKLDKLRKLKQALLEKMFINVNGGGYEAPQIRFKGYTDKWQVKELREVAEFAKGKGYSKGDLTKEGIPIIRYGSLYTDYRTEIDSVSEYVQYSEGAIFSRGGEVIIPASGETSEDIARASAVKLPNVILGGDLNIIYPNAEINAVFLATEITYGKSHTYLAMKAQGASVVHLRKLDISSLSPKFPSISEQQQIGKYFVQMDVQLSKASIKLTKLRNIKQSLLQKMFA